MSLTSAFHRPPLHLAPYVAYFFSLEAPACGAGDSAHAVQVLPVPHMQLVFSFGDESFERTMDGPVVRSPGFAVTGYTTRTVEYLNGGRLGVLMAGLQPWGFRALLARALPPVLDRNIELRALFGGSMNSRRAARRQAKGSAPGRGVPHTKPAAPAVDGDRADRGAYHDSARQHTGASAGATGRAQCLDGRLLRPEPLHQCVSRVHGPHAGGVSALLTRSEPD
jgi:hypothetical protein